MLKGIRNDQSVIQPNPSHPITDTIKKYGGKIFSIITNYKRAASQPYSSLEHKESNF
jgi:hypothetical protein